MIRRPRPDGELSVNRCRITTCSRQTQTDGGTTSRAQLMLSERFGYGDEKTSATKGPISAKPFVETTKKNQFCVPTHYTIDRDDGHWRNTITQTDDNDDDTVIFTCWRFSACAVSVCACVRYIFLKMIITERT